ncbi:unnamed protein product [Tenebrio molitor]|nr:unnamed protein product [Tenebrio molitor]
MKPRTLIFFLLVCYCSCAKFPPNFKRCNRKQPDFKECFFKAVEHAVSQMTVSMKEVGLPKLDPMSIPSMSIAAGTSAAAFEQNYENITLSGFTKNNCSKIEIDFDEKTMHLDCGSDLIVMNFDYEFIGNILLLPIRSKGPGKVDIIKPKNVLTLKFEEYEKKGKQYIRITDHKFLWTPQQLVFNLENLFGDNEALNKNLNDVFNENWKALYDDSGPSYEAAFGKIFAAIANSFFGRVPVSELFDN